MAIRKKRLIRTMLVLRFGIDMPKMFLIVLIFLEVISLPYYSEAEDSFSIAIVRADGVLIPIGHYKDGQWLTLWPKFDENLDLELKSLSDIPRDWLRDGMPFKKQWNLWQFDGSKNIIKLIRPSKDNRCDDVWGVQSDMQKKPEKCRNCCPFPKIGFATDAEIPLQLIKKVEAPQRIREFIKKQFEQFEKRELDLLLSSTSESSRKCALAFHQSQKKSEVKMKIYQISLPTGKFYYFEAQRTYKKSAGYPDQACANITFFQGWIMEQPKKMNLINETFSITDCDYKLISNVEPLALLNIYGKTYVLSRRTGYESEEYIIFELSDSQIKLVLESLIHAL